LIFRFVRTSADARHGKTNATEVSFTLPSHDDQFKIFYFLETPTGNANPGNVSPLFQPVKTKKQLQTVPA